MFRWNSVYVKAVLAVTAIASFVIASGAGMKWS